MRGPKKDNKKDRILNIVFRMYPESVFKVEDYGDKNKVILEVPELNWRKARWADKSRGTFCELKEGLALEFLHSRSIFI